MQFDFGRTPNSSKTLERAASKYRGLVYLILILTIFSLCSAVGKSSDGGKNRKSLKAQELSFLTKKEQKDVMAFFEVHRGVSKLQVYLNKQDNTSLAPLLEGWSLEDQTLLKHDLAKLPKNLQVEVSGQTLVFKVGESKIKKSSRGELELFLFQEF